MSLVHLSIILLTFLSHFPVINALDGKGQGKNRWAVIVAGAQDYFNYFSQANACHGYHVLRHGGVLPENIIQLNYDDVANSYENPVRGNLINTLNGSNIYEGCIIDYRGQDVTPEVFIAVLTGNATGIEALTGKKGKVLMSGPDDEVFLYMTDHGNFGQFEFPSDSLSTNRFFKALETMYEQKMYNQMVLFMDSCYSGSMFEGLLPDNLNIYAVTSTNTEEVGRLNCWDGYRQVFLSSLFSYTWMYTADQFDRNEVTLYQLYEKAYKACTNYPSGVSHPHQYGNTSFNKYFIDRFMGDNKGTNKSHFCEKVPFMDEKTLEMLRNEFEFPFEEDVLSFSFLQRPPIDMGGVATLIRRLMSKTLTQEDRESLKAQLTYLLKIKVIARELMKAVEEHVIKSVKNYSPLRFSNIDRIGVLRCYNQAMESIKSRCPILKPKQFPFVNRSFHVLINLCKGVGKEIVINAIETVSMKSYRV